MITVRSASIADAPAMSAVLIASITELCVADHHNHPEALQRWLGNKSPEAVARWFDSAEIRLFVAEQNGAIAAAGGYSLTHEIILNYVAPAHRFTGVSKALLKAMEAALGPGEATLHSSETAHRFYLARGWADTGVVDRYEGMVSYPMRKILG